MFGYYLYAHASVLTIHCKTSATIVCLYTYTKPAILFGVMCWVLTVIIAVLPLLSVIRYYIWFSSTNRRNWKSQWGFESKCRLIYNITVVLPTREAGKGARSLRPYILYVYVSTSKTDWHRRAERRRRWDRSVAAAAAATASIHTDHRIAASSLRKPPRWPRNSISLRNRRNPKCTRKIKGEGSPHSITERRVPELIPVLGSQSAGDMSHKPGGRLLLLSARPAVTHAESCYQFRWLVNRGMMGVNSLPKAVTRQRPLPLMFKYQRYWQAKMVVFRRSDRSTHVQ